MVTWWIVGGLCSIRMHSPSVKVAPEPKNNKLYDYGAYLKKYLKFHFINTTEQWKVHTDNNMKTGSCSATMYPQHFDYYLTYYLKPNIKCANVALVLQKSTKLSKIYLDMLLH